MSTNQTQYFLSNAANFHVEANFQSSFTPFHVALLRIAQFFYFPRAFVTRDIVITLWILITVFD